MRAARRWALGFALLALGGCERFASGCQWLGEGKLEVGGATPYVRCLAGAPPESRTLAFGRLKLALAGRELHVTGLPHVIRMAAFSGPSFGPPPDASVIRALAQAKPDLAVMLGGLGDDDATAKATAKALGGLPAPTLLVAGGRDTLERIGTALRVLPVAARKVVDVTALHAIRLGRDTFIPVAGASSGHYALEDRACGFGLDDLKRRASALGAASTGERRWLLAWEAPGLGGALSIARSDTGSDAGSADLAELARRVGAPGGLFAWPEVQVGRARAGDGTRVVPVGVPAPDLRIVVPRLTGAATERADGSRVMAGFALVRLEPGGLSVESIATP